MLNDMKKFQIISIWFIIMIIALFLYVNSLYILPSTIMLLSTFLICTVLILQINANKVNYFFSPLAQLGYAFMYYCNIIGLFYFSRFNNIPLFSLPTNDSVFLSKVALLYLLYCIALFLPYILFAVFKIKLNININVMKRNFSMNRLKLFFIISIIILIFLLASLFILSKTSIISAILNPAIFKSIYVRNFPGIIYVIFSTILNMSLLLFIKVFIVDKKRVFKTNLYKYIFILFYIFWILVSGSRSQILAPIIYYIYFVSFTNFKIKIKDLFKVGVILILTIVFSMFYYVYRSYMDISIRTKNVATREQLASFYEYITSNKSDNDVIEKNPIKNAISRIDNFSNSVRYFYYVEKSEGDIIYNDTFNLQKQLKSQFTSIIPRMFLSEKGYPVSKELTSLVYPETSQADVNFIFGGIVNYYYTFGISLIVLSGLFIGTLVTFFQQTYKKHINYDFYLFNYVCIFLNIPIMEIEIGFINTARLIPFIVKAIISLLLTYLLTKKIIYRSGENGCISRIREL